MSHSLADPLGDTQFCQRVVGRRLPLLVHVENLASLSLEAIVDGKVEILEHLHRQLSLPSHRLRFWQVEQSVEDASDGGHVVVLQPVLLLQILRGIVLATETFVGDVLCLTCCDDSLPSCDEHLIVGGECRQAFADLLCHTIVIGVRQAN